MKLVTGVFIFSTHELRELHSTKISEHKDYKKASHHSFKHLAQSAPEVK